MSAYDRIFSPYLEIALTPEDREIWQRMTYPQTVTYMNGHVMDIGTVRYMTEENSIFRPMQPAMAARIRLSSAERLGVLNDRFAIY